ncbi:unnamed protein product [Urochloa humidicola]
MSPTSLPPFSFSSPAFSTARPALSLSCEPHLSLSLLLFSAGLLYREASRRLRPPPDACQLVPPPARSSSGCRRPRAHGLVRVPAVLL